MATSSIVEKIRVNNPKVLEEYVASLESSANTSQAASKRKTGAVRLTDPDEMKKVIKKGIRKSSRNK